MHTSSNVPGREGNPNLRAQSGRFSSHSCRWRFRPCGYKQNSSSVSLAQLFRWKHCSPSSCPLLFSLAHLAPRPSSISLPEQQLWCHKVGDRISTKHTQRDMLLVEAECTWYASPTTSVGIGCGVLCRLRHGLPQRRTYSTDRLGQGTREDYADNIFEYCVFYNIWHSKSNKRYYNLEL